jgi:hypothetical protein
MNQRKAFKATMDLAYERGMHHLILREDLSFRHLEDMYRQVNKQEFSEAKLGRWLGWAQATVVASGVATLEDMKGINKRYSEEYNPVTRPLGMRATCAACGGEVARIMHTGNVPGPWRHTDVSRELNHPASVV